MTEYSDDFIIEEARLQYPGHDEYKIRGVERKLYLIKDGQIARTMDSFHVYENHCRTRTLFEKGKALYREVFVPALESTPGAIKVVVDGFPRYFMPVPYVIVLTQTELEEMMERYRAGTYGYPYNHGLDLKSDMSAKTFLQSRNLFIE